MQNPREGSLINRSEGYFATLESETARRGPKSNGGGSSPAGGDDVGSLLLVGDGEGADGSAVPEDSVLALGVVHGVGRGVDVDAG